MPIVAELESKHGASVRKEGKEDRRKKENEKERGKREWQRVAGEEQNGGRLGNNRRQKRGRRRSSRVKRERAVIFATKGESQWISVRGGAAKRSGLKARSSLLIARLFSSVRPLSPFHATDFQMNLRLKSAVSSLVTSWSRLIDE